MYESIPQKRYNNTLKFARKFLSESDHILDLGVPNPLADLLKAEGFKIKNTRGEDLDENYNQLSDYDVDVVTAFQILEHLLNPYMVLKNLPSDKLLVSVPLRLWFAEPFQKGNDPRTRHFHEFTDWQFDWLLDKTGWKIKHREKWINPSRKIGIRPLLRSITPRYYAIYAER